MSRNHPQNHTKIVELLREHGIQTTHQRIAIAEVLLARPQHLSADQVLAMVNHEQRHVSKATVYNTLALFTRRGLIREIIADPERTFYDSNTRPHHHFYNVDSGEISDVRAHDIHVEFTGRLPEGTKLEDLEVVVRIRSGAA
jgi:Fur family iron response transcriptional regulator